MDAGAQLQLRNVVVTDTGAEYDLYFSYDESYYIQTGKSLGIRVHEYGSLYDFSVESLIADAEVRTAGYGNGGQSTAFFLDQDMLSGQTEIAVAHITWTPNASSVEQTRTEWADVLTDFGDGEYATTALGFSQELSYTARDVALSSALIDPYQGGVTVDDALTSLEFTPENLSENIDLNSNFEIIFNDNIQSGTGLIELIKDGSTVVETFSGTSPNLTIAGKK